MAAGRERAVSGAMTGPTAELTPVRGDDRARPLPLFWGDVLDVFTGVHNFAPFEITSLEFALCLIRGRQKHRDQLRGCVNHGEWAAAW